MEVTCLHLPDPMVSMSPFYRWRFEAVEFHFLPFEHSGQGRSKYRTDVHECLPKGVIMPEKSVNRATGLSGFPIPSPVVKSLQNPPGAYWMGFDDLYNGRWLFFLPKTSQMPTIETCRRGTTRIISQILIWPSWIHSTQDRHGSERYFLEVPDVFRLPTEYDTMLFEHESPRPSFLLFFDHVGNIAFMRQAYSLAWENFRSI